jgi:hypothetical protein
MRLNERSACELCGKEAPQEDAEAQAPQDAQEDAVAAQAQVAQRSVSTFSNKEAPAGPPFGVSMHLPVH